jgi:hypothetical protein
VYYTFMKAKRLLCERQWYPCFIIINIIDTHIIYVITFINVIHIYRDMETMYQFIYTTDESIQYINLHTNINMMIQIHMDSVETLVMNHYDRSETTTMIQQYTVGR